MKRKNWFQALWAFKCNVRRYSAKTPLPQFAGSVDRPSYGGGPLHNSNPADPQRL
jgi:hypothetical protein